MSVHRIYCCQEIISDLKIWLCVGLWNFELTPVAQNKKKVQNAIHWIHFHPVESAIGLLNTYPLNNDLSGGLRYPTLKELGREL